MRATAISRRSLCAGAVASLASVFPPMSARATGIYTPVLSLGEMTELAPKLIGQLRRDMVEHIVCVDGRNKKFVGLIHTSGAAKGILLRALAYGDKLAASGISISHDDMFDAVVHAIGGVKHFNYHVGCAYCDLVKKEPDQYDSTPEIASYTDVAMRRVPVRPDILPGRHAERAAVVVRQLNPIGPHAKYACVVEDFATLHGKETHVFVHRPDLMESLVFRPMARYLLHISAELARCKIADSLVSDLSEMEQDHFSRLIKEIAPHVPRYEMQLDGDRIHRIRIL